MMLKKLLIILISIFAYSLILAFILGIAYFLIRTQGQNNGQAIARILMGDVFLNLILLIMALPIVFLTAPQFYQHRRIRALLFFGGTIVFMLAVIIINKQAADKIFYEISAISFLLMQLIYYRKLPNQSHL